LKDTSQLIYPYALDERAWLLEKLSLHTDALYIILFVLEDVERATQYCNRVYELETKKPFFQHKKSVYNILADLCFKGIPDLSYNNMLPYNITKNSNLPKFWYAAQQMFTMVRYKFWKRRYQDCLNNLSLFRQSVTMFSHALGIDTRFEGKINTQVFLFRTILLQYDPNCNPKDYEMTIIKLQGLQDDVLFYGQAILSNLRELEDYSPVKVSKIESTAKDPPTSELLADDFERLVKSTMTKLLPDNLREDLELVNNYWDEAAIGGFLSNSVIVQLMDTSRTEIYPELKKNFWYRVQERRHFINEDDQYFAQSYLMKKLDNWITFFEVALFGVARIYYEQIAASNLPSDLQIDHQYAAILGDTVDHIQNQVLYTLEMNASRVKMFEQNGETFLDALDPTQLVRFDPFIEKTVRSIQNQKRLNKIRINNLEALRKQVSQIL
jgi:hypothetical protein